MHSDDVGNEQASLAGMWHTHITHIIMSAHTGVKTVQLKAHPAAL